MWTDFYTSYAFTYINLEVGMEVRGKRRKECDGEITFVR